MHLFSHINDNYKTVSCLRTKIVKKMMSPSIHGLGGPSGLLQRQIESVRQMLNFNESGSAGNQGLGGADPQWKVLVYDQVNIVKLPKHLLDVSLL